MPINKIIKYELFRNTNIPILNILILYNKINATSSVKIKEILINKKLLKKTATETEEIAPAKKYNAIYLGVSIGSINLNSPKMEMSNKNIPIHKAESKWKNELLKRQ
ncbi:MAG: hypothetical protein PHX09_01845 [Clostridia bacterium]|nr:hypothetical protein [Clostridia bacterium]